MEVPLEQVSALAEAIEGQATVWRRDLHRHPEAGWTEFRTASLIARRLTEMGYVVLTGSDVMRSEARMGVPADEVLASCWERAALEGGDRPYMEVMRGGYTGVVGVLTHGQGPTVALRFDIDAVDVDESQDSAHRPAREGFASLHPGVSHACGHDAHAAAGLAIAYVLGELRDAVRGTVKLVFQPAEEGVRGAKPMVAAGVVDDVDYLVGHHVYSGWKLGEIVAGMGGYLATHKFDAVFRGRAAHAAGEPQQGKNALLAAATAAINLYAIARHREGATRINVGQLNAGTGRNVIPAEARMAIETRGKTEALSSYMYEAALRTLRGAAEMHGCTVETCLMGSAASAYSDPALAARVEALAVTLGGFTVRTPEESSGSEDLTYMMARVQSRGGLATNVGIGADLGGWGHHSERFDLDERAIGAAIRLLSALTLDLAADR
ncbi:MAG: amidohydrolase [Anaerolineae bacterium]|nr:amidohydrolase [Anaerolineae bacterium]